MSGFDDDAAEASDEQMEELRARLQRKVEVLRARLLAQDGWTEDKATGQAIPPGWIATRIMCRRRRGSEGVGRPRD